MKKSIIAGAGVAMLGMAAMPFAGVFASNTDTVTVNVEKVCSMSASDKSVAIGTYTPGTDAKTGTGAAMTVTCNAGGWKISAVGAGTGSPVTAMVGSDGAAGATISTVAGETTASSNWGFKFAKTAGSAATTFTTNYDTAYQAIPATSTTIVTGGTYNGNNTATITPTYRVYVANGQLSGTYTGKVTYTFSQS